MRTEDMVYIHKTGVDQSQSGAGVIYKAGDDTFEKSEDTSAEAAEQLQIKWDEYLSQFSESEAESDDEWKEEHVIKSLDKAISEVNKTFKGNIYMECEYDNQTKIVSIKIMNKETQNVIRKALPKSHMEAIINMWEWAGIFPDQNN